MKQVKDWTHLTPEYAGKWIAFAEDEETVIAASKTLKTTLNKAKKQGFKNSPVFKVPIEILPYVGYG